MPTPRNWSAWRCAVLLAVAGAMLGASPAPAVTAQQIRDHFASLPDWNANHGDGFVANGDRAGQTVAAVAVAWMADAAAMAVAEASGCQLLICYSGVFPTSFAGTSLIVLRCHDVWVKRPGEGYRDALRDFLGLAGNPVNADTRSVAAYPIDAMPAAVWAQHVANRFAVLGLEGVELVGNRSKTVRKVALGSGDEKEARAMYLQGADLGVITEYQRWRELWWAIDNDFPLLLVDHGMVETPGAIRLKEHVAREWPSLAVYFINNGPSFSWQEGVQRRNCMELF